MSSTMSDQRSISWNREQSHKGSQRVTGQQSCNCRQAREYVIQVFPAQMLGMFDKRSFKDQYLLLTCLIETACIGNIQCIWCELFLVVQIISILNGKKTTTTTKPPPLSAYIISVFSLLLSLTINRSHMPSQPRHWLPFLWLHYTISLYSTTKRSHEFTTT